jgi:hypothetical protein
VLRSRLSAGFVADQKSPTMARNKPVGKAWRLAK